MRKCILLFAFLCVHAVAAEDDPLRISAAAKSCARDLTREPAFDLRQGDLIITHGHSLFIGSEEYLSVHFSATGASMQYIRPKSKSYVAQCYEFFKAHPAALLDPDAHRDARKEITLEYWRVSGAECPKAADDLRGFPHAVDTLSKAAATLLNPPPPSKGPEKATTIVVRGDGPVYGVRMNFGNMEAIDIRPGIDTEMEQLVESILEHVHECTSKRTPESRVSRTR